MHSHSTDSSQSQLITLDLKPIRPNGDLAHLEKSLEAVPGVERVEIDREERRARIEHKGVDYHELLRVLEVKGYDAHMH